MSLDNGGHVFQRGQNLSIMGVDIQVWRIRIGSFIQPRKSRNALKCLYVSGKSKFSVLRVCLRFSVRLPMCGDVESNPGPARGGHQSQSQAFRPVTRQSTLESFTMDRRASIDPPRSPLLGGGREPQVSYLLFFFFLLM